MQKVVLATGNAGKVRELASLLEDFGLDIVAQTELGVDSAEETGLTFIENAILKARHAAQITGLPAIADDSGLAVDALGGAPGIYSARYSGVDATDQQNLEKLLDALKDVPDDQRQAQFPLRAGLSAPCRGSHAAGVPRQLAWGNHPTSRRYGWLRLRPDILRPVRRENRGRTEP